MVVKRVDYSDCCVMSTVYNVKTNDKENKVQKVRCKWKASCNMMKDGRAE